MASIQVLEIPSVETPIEELSYDATDHIFGGQAEPTPQGDELLITILAGRAGGLGELVQGIVDSVLDRIFG